MTVSNPLKAAASVVLLAAALPLMGCNSDDVSGEVGEKNKSNIQRVANLYAAHQNAKNGTGPKDEAEFKEFIRAFAPDKLQMMRVDAGNPDSVFVSERDGKPFKVRYKVGGGRGSSDPVVFETDGKDGKKQVGFTGGKVEDCDDSTYQAYLSGKAGKTPSGGPSSGPPPGGGGRPGAGGPPPGAPTGPPK